jgi:hypothetical protein
MGEPFRQTWLGPQNLVTNLSIKSLRLPKTGRFHLVFDLIFGATTTLPGYYL